jgi:hypothetical protein
MVMSGVDPHMISGNTGFGLGWFGWVIKVDFFRLWVGHGETP